MLEEPLKGQRKDGNEVGSCWETKNRNGIVTCVTCVTLIKVLCQP